MTARMQVNTSVMILSIILVGMAGCVAPSTQPAAQPTATLPPGWETYANQGQCTYTFSHPSDMDVVSQGTYSWLLNHSTTDPSGPVPNFIYISVIPADFQSSKPAIIYNYDPAETQTLLNLQDGESTSLRDDPNLADWFTYNRLPDRTLSNHTAQTYENNQPWEFPPGTKEIRYYLQANGCTYLIGGYMATVGSGQPGAIDEELFDQIITTFRLAL
jgi:hypothetical protein